MSTKMTLEALGAKTQPAIDLFVCTASFEERCLGIARNVAARTKQAVIIRNKEFTEAVEVHYRTLRTLFEGRMSDALASTESPTSTADALSQEVIARALESRCENIFIDVTTFTHEQVLILMALIKRNQLPGNFTFGYTGAAEYSTNTDEEHVWLSHGVRQVRSILGYPGSLAPSKRLHLIVLLGFESDRARLLIEIMEPTKISLGIGDPDKSVSVQHFSRNERFLGNLKEFLETQISIQAEISRFSFSCIDPYEARDAVLEEAARFQEFNTVLCPMNTKISTVGVGLAALQDPRLQIVYASPEEYNVTGYSSPGESVTTFPVTF